MLAVCKFLAACSRCKLASKALSSSTAIIWSREETFVFLVTKLESSKEEAKVKRTSIAVFGATFFMVARIAC